MTDDRGQKTAMDMVRRTAIILSTCTVADCPLAATCISVESETKRKVVCGHYNGSITNCDGSQVVCGYQGN
ncbi:hypothetical protein [Desulfocastanea catecholica]